MWAIRQKYSADKNTCITSIKTGQQPMSIKQVLHGWAKDEEFRRFYLSLVRALPYEAIFWETPPISLATYNDGYEFAAVNSEQLVNARANSAPFDEHLNNPASNTSVISFDNLGGDSTLIVPCQITRRASYSHLMRFLRESEESQCHEFLQTIAQKLMSKISDKPIWLSTSGLGVYWLHARLDSHPKYYTHQPYRLTR